MKPTLDEAFQMAAEVHRLTEELHISNDEIDTLELVFISTRGKQYWAASFAHTKPEWQFSAPAPTPEEAVATAAAAALEHMRAGWPQTTTGANA
jgi:hypothetical protein